MENKFYKRFFFITVILIFVVGVFVYVNFREIVAAVVVTILLLFISTAYLYYTEQLRFLLSFRWKKIEKWLLNTLFGAIILSWLGTFSYNLLVSDSNNDARIRQNMILSEVKKTNRVVKINQDDILSEIDSLHGGIEIFIKNLPQEIEKRIESKVAFNNKKIEELVLENLQLKKKIKELSIANLNKALQSKIELLVSEYRYEEAQNLIDIFLQEEVYIEDSNLAKLYYQKALIFYAQYDYDNSKRQIEKAIELDNQNVSIVIQYAKVLGQISARLNSEYIDESLNTIELESNNVSNLDNVAVAYANKMNIVYRGIQNPVTIYYTGVSDDNVTAIGNGLKKVSGNSYMLSPGLGKDVTINISGILSDGSRVSDSKNFRILEVPRPTGTIRGESGVIRITRSNLETSPVGVKLGDFLFDLNLKVKSFKLKIPGQPAIHINGFKFNSEAKKLLSKAKKGEIIQIFDIRASITGKSSYSLRKVSPITVELID
ncbi:GldM family protein [Dokdonia ponticola]|uniref:GldM family protein n=1 Tax=Dokdonia ponticola TaxID=2041041 RepID=A0ABV9HZ43_9FLAO